LKTLFVEAARGLYLKHSIVDDGAGWGIDDHTVTFSYKDYRQGASKQKMTLDALEFIRRFSLHILPKGFVRIRHYGILSSTSKSVAIPCIKAQTETVSNIQLHSKAEIYNPKVCTHCKTETMVTIEILTKRGPPEAIKPNNEYMEQVKK
jgi:hypothetical protein